MFIAVINATSSSECCTIAVSIGFLWFLDLRQTYPTRFSNAHSILAKLKMESEIHYPSVQINQRRCYVPPKAIGEFYPLIHENHRKFIQTAAKNRTSTTWKSSFSPGIIHYLNNLLNIALPIPAYFSDSISGKEVQNLSDDEQTQKIGGDFGDPETNQKTMSNHCWWFGVNNINKRSSTSKNHVIYPELTSLLDGSQKEFEWHYHNKSKRFYELIQPGDKIVFWMGDGDNLNWGIFGFGRVSRVLQNNDPALRSYFLSMDFIPSSPVTPYPSKHPQETETTKLLLELFGVNFRPLGKTFRNLGYDTVRTIITIDEVESEKYNSLLEYAQIYSPKIDLLDYANKLEKDIASGEIIDSPDVESRLQQLAPDILRLKAQSAKRKPEKQKTQSMAYARSPFVSAYAKQRANGICQLCNTPAPFVSRKGEPYLETHHIIWLSNGGDDTIENTVALCPNCHRKMHKLDLADDKKHLEQKAKSLAQ